MNSCGQSTGWILYELVILMDELLAAIFSYFFMSEKYSGQKMGRAISYFWIIPLNLFFHLAINWLMIGLIL